MYFNNFNYAKLELTQDEIIWNMRTTINVTNANTVYEGSDGAWHLRLTTWFKSKLHNDLAAG